MQYTGSVGIPEITVSPKPRITDAASLYTLGPAYTIAPDEGRAVPGGATGRSISKLLTDHGPWEGYNVTRKELIRFQTTAHTLGLILGLLGNGVGPHEALPRLARARASGSTDSSGRARRRTCWPTDAKVFAWAPKGHALKSAAGNGGFRVTGERVGEVGIAFVPAGKAGVNLSGGRAEPPLPVRRPGGPGRSSSLKPPGPSSRRAASPRRFSAVSPTRAAGRRRFGCRCRRRPG